MAEIDELLDLNYVYFIVLQNDHASRSLLGEHTRSRIQTQSMPMIRKSRRSPLTSKILKYGGEKVVSSPRPREDTLQINCIFSYHGDDSDKERTTLRPQGPKSHKVVAQLERETQLRVVSSHDKVREQNKNAHIG